MLNGSGATANLLGADNDVTIETDSDDEQSGADKNGFDNSKWKRVVLMDELSSLSSQKGINGDSIRW